GDHVRPKRGKLVGRLSDQPLAAGFILQIAGGKVVAATESGYVRKRIPFADVSGFLADNHHQLNFVIELFGDLDRQLDSAFVMIESNVELAEQHWRFGNRRADLLGMLAVVQAYADN